eukprot:163153_1
MTWCTYLNSCFWSYQFYALAVLIYITSRSLRLIAAVMEYSVIVTWMYFGLYFTMILVASFVCAIHVRDEYKNETDETTNADHDETTTEKETTDTSPQKKHGCKHYLKKWLH